MIQNLTSNCQDTQLKLQESQAQLQEKEETIVTVNSMKSKYEYKINFLQEKLNKGSSGSEDYENKLLDLEKKLASVLESSKQKDEQISGLEDKCKEVQETSTKVMIQQTNNIRKNYEDQVKELKDSNLKLKESNLKMEEQLQDKAKRKKGEVDQLKKLEEKIK